MKNQCNQNCGMQMKKQFCDVEKWRNVCGVCGLSAAVEIQFKMPSEQRVDGFVSFTRYNVYR